MARQVKKKTKAKRKNNKVADLKIISPGVMVNENYKPGADPALDAVLRKLKKDGPGSLDRSGLSPVYKIPK